ncbi:ketoacyl-ACP synthase III [Acidiferrimicrobium sp. IK]|uniref:beta-ketoacyl-ACP synthase III n=1 Tax=Acidiferrimicrobium sp. IK TaxID=2871700 RepID=UPI0021CB00B4|nr:beta-ketoacyl-ACP synthase III [Acidiferrimicrobium sp. IK]MCU4183595.1 ketoacyl-ACP synthase III [Acidiferrimicrobium sp. IK]
MAARLVTTRGAAITGWGTALPDRVVTNTDIMTLFETSDEWIRERSGIATRRVATGPFITDPPPHHPPDGLGTTGQLAVAAGREALAASGIEGSDVGLVILCTTTPDQLIPASSAAVSSALGIAGGAMDINAACAGFTYGLVTASSMVAAGLDRVLLIGAETLSRATNWEDRTNAFLFGDGAGAVVVEAIPGETSLLGWDLGVDGSLVPILYADHGSGMVMKGQEVFRRAVRATVASATLSLERAKVSADDIALFVPHQANIRIMDAVADRLGLHKDKIASVIDHTGNTSSASIPLALVEAAKQGRLADGDLVLLAGFGAGMTWASAVWRWGH